MRKKVKSNLKACEVIINRARGKAKVERQFSNDIVAVMMLKFLSTRHTAKDESTEAKMDFT